MAAAVSAGVVLVGVITLVLYVMVEGWSALTPGFLTAPHSRFPEEAGLGPALSGSFWLMVTTVAVAFPVGVGAALFLEEYARPGRVVGLIQASMINLAGIPSVIYGIIGLAVFVRGLALGESVLAGGLTLAALAVPTVFFTALEAIRAVPEGLREAAYGLGATRWQVVRHHVLPSAAGGIVTGSTLAFSRAVGETAPLLVIGAVAFVAFSPVSAADPFTSVPTQIYSWISRPEEGFRSLAAGASIVLFSILLAMNLLAALIRRRFGSTI